MAYESLFIANSAYSLYLYLLLRPELINKTLFLCGPAIADNDLPHKINLDLSDKTQEEAKNYQEFLLRKVKHKLGAKNVPCYANLVTPYASEFLGRYPVYALSDGLGDATLFPKYLTDERITGCYATDLGNSWENEGSGYGKLKVVNPIGLWHQKTQDEQENIQAVFGIDRETLNILRQKKVILLTQPLSEDGIVSEDDKVRLYRSIVGKYNVSDVVIKPHPREKTDWATLFPTVPVISRRMPAEALAATINLERVATFFSTGAFHMTTPDKVDIYSKDFRHLVFSHPDRKMGRMPYVDIEGVYGEKPFNWKRISDATFYRDYPYKQFAKTRE